MTGTVFFKELKLILKDKSSFIIMILMPAVLMTILSFALSGTFTNSTWTDPVKTAVVKEYSGFPDSDNVFFTRFLDNEDIKKLISYEITDEDKAVKMLDEGKIASIIYLPENFPSVLYSSHFLNKDEKTVINITANPEMKYSSMIVNGLISGFNSVFNSNIAVQNAVDSIYDENNIPSEQKSIINDSLIFSVIESSNNLNIEYIGVDKKESLTSFQYYSTAIMAMFLFFTAGFTATRLLREIRNHTWQRQIISGVLPGTLLKVNFFLGAVVTFLQIAVLILFSYFAFGVKWGNFLNAAVIAVIASLSMGGLSLLMASITLATNNFKLTNAFLNIIVQVFALLGGSYIPIEVMPRFMQYFADFTVNGLSIKAWTGIMQGYSLLDNGLYIAGLIGFGMLFTFAGTVIYRLKGVKYT